MRDLVLQGKGIVAGGLDALELLGKKTIDVISEGDKGILSVHNPFIAPLCESWLES